MTAAIETAVETLGSNYRAASLTPLGGSGFCELFRLSAVGESDLFVKAGRNMLDPFQAEQQGLALLTQCDAFRVPAVLCCTGRFGLDVLLMEWIQIAPLEMSQGAQFGEALAQLHSIEAPGFGLEQNNFIGATPQINDWHAKWWPFYCQRRLGYQLDLAGQRGLPGAVKTAGQTLLPRIEQRFQQDTPKPGLLHGDLWLGNTGVDPQGNPVIFDPAVYYGDPDTDIAMSRLFGSLPDSVYQAYRALRPARGQWPVRQMVYDLYHWLNHYNLFGGGYLNSVVKTIQQLQRLI